MSIIILVANVLTLLAFLLHTFVGDKEIREIQPKIEGNTTPRQQELWTMARSGWHWVSYDLLMASIGLALINFTEILEGERQLLQLLAIYFIGYGAVWLIVIAISKSFPNNYLKLGQWILLWLIGALILLGI